MPREVISTPEAPEYPAYSQAVKVANTIYVAGTVGVDVATGQLAGPTVQDDGGAVPRTPRVRGTAPQSPGGALSSVCMTHLLGSPEKACAVTSGDGVTALRAAVPELSHPSRRATTTTGRPRQRRR